MAKRFVTDEYKIEGDKITVFGKEAHHIAVLRHKIGDEIEINNNKCRIVSIEKEELVAKIIESVEARGIPHIDVTLFQALLKSDKLEYVIQKSVELGITKIIPFESKNIVVKLNEKDKLKKNERWNKISVEASKQCGRTDIVPVEEICTFNEMLEKLNDYDKIILAYEKETKPLKEVLNNTKKDEKIAIIIGAEGGFEIEETEKILKQNNTYSVSLGERILRAETASLNLISIIMYVME